jgi:hypothetical protein
MKKHGVRFQPSLSGTLQLSRTNAFFMGGGKALLNAYYRSASSLGVEICYESPVDVLAIRDGRFVAAHCKGERIEARACVLAAGGFESNLEWLREAWGQNERGEWPGDNLLIRGTRFDQGVLLKHLRQQGADFIGDPSQSHCVTLALGVGAARFWRGQAPGAASGAALAEAAGNALGLKYLDGGHGDGCNEEDDRFTLVRRRFHHLTFYGFLERPFVGGTALRNHLVDGMTDSAGPHDQFAVLAVGRDARRFGSLRACAGRDQRGHGDEPMIGIHGSYRASAWIECRYAKC